MAMPPEIMRAGWPQYYTLVGKTPVAVDTMTWAMAFEKRHKSKTDPWRVANTIITDRCYVSTVFIGLDHRFSGKGAPLLFETMTFGGPLDGERGRYTTWDEAKRGHAEFVARARKACAQVDALMVGALRSNRKRPSKGWRRHVRREKAKEMQ